MTSQPLFWLGLVVLALFSLLFIWVPFMRSDRKAWGKAALLGVGLFSCSLILYRYWGDSQDYIHVKAYNMISVTLDELSAKENLNLDDVLNRLAGLKGKINHSHHGLARLGGIYSELGQPQQAVELLEEAMLLAPKNADYALQWIYHQSFLNQGKLPAKARDKARTLLEEPYARQAAMNMIAMDDYFQGNYDSAISYWEEILETDQTLTDSRREVLEKALANAKASQK